MKTLRTKNWMLVGVVALMSSPLILALDAIHGTVSKIDSTTKTIIVKLADGTQHTLHLVADTTVHGTEAAAKDTFHGLKVGAEVVAHYTAKGAENTAVEIDKVGKGGMKAVGGGQ